MTTAQPGQEQRMVTDAMIEAGRVAGRRAALSGPDLTAIYTAMHSARPTADLGEDGEWQPAATAPHAMHFLAAYFYEAGGEWIYDVATLHHDHICGASEGNVPFTHWRPLPAPPSAVLSRSGG